MRIRLMRSDDVGTVVDVGSAAFEVDGLNEWLYPRRKQYPAAHRNFILVCNKRRQLAPNVHAIVAESTAEDGDMWNGKPETLGYAYYTHHIKTTPQEKWYSYHRRLSNLLNRRLLSAELWYSDMLYSPSDDERMSHFMDHEYEAIKRLEEKWNLTVLAVNPIFQGNGVGTKLVQWGMDKAKQDGLPVALEASIPGRRLYAKLGFVPVGTHHYTDKVNGVAMIWEPQAVERI